MSKLLDDSDLSLEFQTVTSIYPDEFEVISISSPDHFNSEGIFRSRLQLDSPISFSYFLSGEFHQCELRYLPRVTLHIIFPNDYPAKSPPRFTLSCVWLTTTQIKEISNELFRRWESERGSQILYNWCSFLQNDLIGFLRLSEGIHITSDHQCYSRQSSTGVPNSATSTPLSLPPQACSSASASSFATLFKSDFSRQSSKPGFSRQMSSAARERLAQLLIDYDAREERSVFRASAHECPICMCERRGSECVRVDGCRHVFCADCFREFLSKRVAEGSVAQLECPANKCDAVLHPSLVRASVSSELYERYERLLLDTGLSTMGDVHYCPRVQCAKPVIIDRKSTIATCAHCLFSFCTKCGRSSHGVAPCRREVVRQQIDPMRAAAEASFDAALTEHNRAVLQEYDSLEWIEQNTKKCPNCGINVQKFDGCNKMTCYKCNRYFCWLCLAKLRSSNPYSHFHTLDADGLNAACMRQLFAVPPDAAQPAAAEENANDEAADDAAQADAAAGNAPEDAIEPVQH